MQNEKNVRISLNLKYMSSFQSTIFLLQKSFYSYHLLLSCFSPPLLLPLPLHLFTFGCSWFLFFTIPLFIFLSCLHLALSLCLLLSSLYLFFSLLYLFSCFFLVFSIFDYIILFSDLYQFLRLSFYQFFLPSLIFYCVI